MNKRLAWAVGLLVIVAGLALASEAKAPSIVFTLASSESTTSGDSPGIYFRLAGRPAVPAAIGTLAGSGSVEDAVYPYNTGFGCETFSRTPATIGYANTAVGFRALNNPSGNENTACGLQALYDNGGDRNTAVGISALLENIMGNENTAVGSGAMVLNATGNNNVAIGSDALRDKSAGSYNVAVGHSAGYEGDGNFNIQLGAYVGYPESSDTNTIRIGSPYNPNAQDPRNPAWLVQWGQNRTFIAGIVETPMTAVMSPTVVGITSEGRLGTMSSDLLPPGPKGDKGDQGIQGLPGEGLVTGSILMLPAGTAPPVGYALLGSTTLAIKPANGRAIPLTINVYKKQ